MTATRQKFVQRFVILEHDHPFLHWDFLMQRDDVLASWRLLDPVVTGQWLAAETLPDHRLVYLDYEGPVSHDRGTVKRIASGSYVEAFDVALQPNDAGPVRTFALHDCSLATVVVGRRLETDQPQWRFE